jgi:hypothetical protein
MSVFGTKIKEVERERKKFSIIGFGHIAVTCEMLQYRNEAGFLSLEMQEVLSNGKKDGLDIEVDLFMEEAFSLYRLF